MKSNYLLFPPVLKYFGIGLILFYLIDIFKDGNISELFDISLRVPVIYKSGNDGSGPILFGFSKENIGTTLRLLISFLGSFFVIFSKEKKEDEFVNNMRLSCLLRSLFIYHIFGIILILGFYGQVFLDLYFGYLNFIPIIYTVYFHIILFKNGYF